MFYKYFIWPCQTTSFKSCSVKLHCFNIAAFWVDTPFYLLRQILVMKFILVTKPQHVLLSNGTTPGEDQMFCCDWEKKNTTQKHSNVPHLWVPLALRGGNMCQLACWIWQIRLWFHLFQCPRFAAQEPVWRSFWNKSCFHVEGYTVSCTCIAL